MGPGPPLPVLAGGERSRRWLDGKADPHHAVGVTAFLAESGVAEHAQHPLVAGKGLGDEAADAVLLGRRGQVLEEEAADAPALVGVVDDEGDFGLGIAVHASGRLAVVAGHRHQLVTQLGHQREAVVVVDVDESIQQMRREAGERGEEAEVDRLRRQPAVE